MDGDTKAFVICCVLVALVIISGIVGATVYNMHKIDECFHGQESPALIAMCR